MDVKRQVQSHANATPMPCNAVNAKPHTERRPIPLFYGGTADNGSTDRAGRVQRASNAHYAAARWRFTGHGTGFGSHRWTAWRVPRRDPGLGRGFGRVFPALYAVLPFARVQHD